MKIDNIGYNYTHNEDFYIHRPDGTTDYLFLLIRSDAAVNGSETKSGTYILYNIGTPQYYEASGSAFCNDWIHFSADDAEIKQLSKLGIKFDTPVYIGECSDLSELVRRISCEFFSVSEHKERIVQMYFNILMMKISERSAENHYDRTKVNRFDELRSAIYSTPSNDWNIEKLAEQAALSRSRFQHLYKHFFGVGILSDIISSRIEHAKYILITTDIPVKRVAEMCGYSNDVHFVRQFKDRTGLAPGKFRKKMTTP